MIPIGTKVCVNANSPSIAHIGILVSYFVANDVWDDGRTEVYGVIKLDVPYWTEGQHTRISLLPVHSGNLEVYRASA